MYLTEHNSYSTFTATWLPLLVWHTRQAEGRASQSLKVERQRLLHRYCFRFLTKAYHKAKDSRRNISRTHDGNACCQLEARELLWPFKSNLHRLTPWPSNVKSHDHNKNSMWLIHLSTKTLLDFCLNKIIGEKKKKLSKYIFWDHVFLARRY